jgi:hypothetical protein
MMFGKVDAKRLVECAGRALEAEDRYLANCFKARHWKGSEHGICAWWNERYYQFVIWRELMSSFPWRPELEWNLHDLAFFDNETDTDVPVAVAEIKLWASQSGTSELPAIKADMNALGLLRIPGVMLIFTAQLSGEAEDNFCWLAERLAVSRAGAVLDSGWRFRTRPWAAGCGNRPSYSILCMFA